MPYSVRTETEPTGYTVKTVSTVREDIGLAVIAANYGLKVIPPYEAAESTGFKTLWQSDMNAPLGERRDQSIETAGQTITAAIAALGMVPQDIQRLALGFSVLRGKKYLPEIIESGHLSHLNPEKQTEYIGLACNSGVRALQKVLERGERVPTIVATIDDLTGGLTTPEEADDLSRIIFSNGITALSFVPGEGLSHITGSRLIVKPDVEKALAVQTDYPSNKVPDKNIGKVITKGNMEYILIPRSDDPRRMIEMNGRRTIELFLPLVKNNLPGILEEPEYKDVQTWLSHEPNKKLFESIGRKFPGLGLEWTKIDGNISGGTIFMALVQRLNELVPGSKLGLLGFGAGASMTVEVVKLGRQ